MSSHVLSAVIPRRFATSARRPLLLERISMLLAAPRAQSQSRHAADELMSMSDRQLLDIGLGRGDVIRFACGGRR